MSARHEKRSDPRQPVMVLAELDGGHRHKSWVRVRDISDGGLRLATRYRLKVGRLIALRLPQGNWLSARVIWAEPKLAGVRFCRKIDAEAFFARHAIGSPDRSSSQMRAR